MTGLASPLTRKGKNSVDRNVLTRYVLLILILLILIIPALLSPEIHLGNQTPSLSRNSPAIIPAHSRPNSAIRSSSNQVNVYALYSSEPAPIGIADYGIGPNGAYEYSTNSFLGVANIESLSTQDVNGTGWMSFQLNVNLVFTSQSNQEYTYWIQDLAQVNTADNSIFILDNVWNQSATKATMIGSAISGNGKVVDCNCSADSSFYYYFASASLPGNAIYFSLPLVLEFRVNSTLSSSGQPEVVFAYNDGYGWQTYDTVTFPNVKNPSIDRGFVVSGLDYNPRGTFDDSELVMAGVSSGFNTTDVHSNVLMQLEYWNGHNYQAVYNAYNFGSDTAESMSNAISQGYYFYANGSLRAQVLAGAGTLGKLYDQSQVSIVSVQSPLSSGRLYVINASSSAVVTGYPFVGGDVNITIYPGNYVFYVYDSSGNLVARKTASVTAGQYLSLHVSTSTLVTLTLGYSSVGGNPPTAPKITYYLNGVRTTSLLGTSQSTYYMDPGSSWNVTSSFSGSTQNERWQTNKATSGVASSSGTMNFTYYHQFVINASYSVVGGENPVVSFTYSSLGQQVTTSLSATTHQYWADAQSSFSFPQLVQNSTVERWKTIGNVTSGVVSNPGTISPVFYHQYLVSLQFVALGGANTHAALSINITQFGSLVSKQLNASEWVDAESSYSFPQTLSSSNSSERWIHVGTLSLNGTFGSSSNIAQFYVHQFYVTIASANPSAGSANPSSGWYNASATIILQETNNSGWGLGGWIGSGEGAYFGNKSTQTITASGSITEQAIFYPALTITATNGGSVAYSYNSVSGTVAQGSSVTLYVPVGTTVSLSSSPSSFLYSFQQWSGNSSGSMSPMYIRVSSPSHLQANYSYNNVTITGLVSVPVVIIVIAVAYLMMKKRKAS